MPNMIQLAVELAAPVAEIFDTYLDPCAANAAVTRK